MFTRPVVLALVAVLLVVLGVAAFVYLQPGERAALPPASSAPAVPSSSAADAPASASPQPTSTDVPVATATATATPRADPVLVGAGDIADCGSNGDEATAALLDAIAGTVVTLGDNVYSSGTPDQFVNCYAPSWGRHLARTRPSVGNHEYETFAAAGYFGYFGAAAGQIGQGWYSYDVGEWHIVVLNSICGAVGGCHAGSAQEQWLRADLAANPAACTLAYWHNPRFSSAQHGSDANYDAFWRALYEADADVVLVGHDHVYERFAPQTPDAVADPVAGIRQFTVGTGGKSFYAFETVVANSEIRDNSTFGVLALTLHPTSYDWEFIPAAGGTFTDSGTGACH